MKKILLFAAVCCSIIAMADDKPQLDSIVILDGGAIGKVMKAVYTYDKKGRMDEVIGSFMINGKWEYATKNKYTYDASNDTTSIIYSVWKADKNDWQVSSMWEYTWKSKGVKTVETESNWDSNKSQMVNNTRKSWVYNSANQCTKYTLEKWDENKWQPSSRETYTWTSTGKIDIVVKENYYSSTGWMYIGKEDYDYNGADQVEFKAIYAVENDQWKEKYLYEYTYENGLLKEYTYWLMDTGRPDFDKVDQWRYTYDSKNNVLKKEYYDWDESGEGSWKKYLEYEYTYTSSGDHDKVTEIRREWKNDGVEETKVEMIYDALSGVMLLDKHSKYNTSSKKWETSYSYVYYYKGIEPLGIVKVSGERLGVNGEGRKFFRNGQMLIFRDGKTYTVSGQVVE